MVTKDYTWNQVFGIVGDVFRKITGIPDGIVAVLPQGMIPACLLQQLFFEEKKLYIPMILVAYEGGQVRSWDMQGLKIKEKPHLLIVDAVIRSGDFMTLEVNEVLRQIEGATFETAVLLQQKDGPYVTSYCGGNKLGKDERIRFPWQVK